MTQSLLKKLEPLLSDNQSGSSVLINRLQDILLQHYKENSPKTGEIRRVCSEVIKTFPDFMVMHHFLDYLVQEVEESQGIHLYKVINEYQKQWTGIGRSVAENLESEILNLNGPFLFHSNSGALQALVEYWHTKGQKPEIIQTIGRPAKEGKKQAKVMANKGVKVKLIEDIAASLYSDQIEAIFLGADAIGKKQFKNKTGSLFLGLLAEQKGVPVYVLADSRKQIPANCPVSFSQIFEQETPKPGSEPWQGQIPGNIAVDNHYFEWTPNKLVTKFVTEEGSKSPGELSNKSLQFANAYLTLLNKLSAEIR